MLIRLYILHKPKFGGSPVSLCMIRVIVGDKMLCKGFISSLIALSEIRMTVQAGALLFVTSFYLICHKHLQKRP